METVTGDKELLRKLNKLSVDLQEATAEAVYGTAQAIRGTAIKSIQRLSAGSVVSRAGQGGKQYQHTASRPGDAPNTDTGRLVSSIQVQPLSPNQTMFVGTSLKYGKHLEFGTGSMEARPWLMPAVDANDTTFRKQLEKAIDRQIDKAQR